MLTSIRLPSFRRRTVSRAVKRLAAQHLARNSSNSSCFVRRHAGQAPAHSLLRRPAEDGLRRAVPGHHLAAGRDRHDRQRGRFDHRRQLVARRADHLLVLPLLGHVALGAPDRRQPPVLDHARAGC